MHSVCTVGRGRAAVHGLKNRARWSNADRRIANVTLCATAIVESNFMRARQARQDLARLLSQRRMREVPTHEAVIHCPPIATTTHFLADRVGMVIDTSIRIAPDVDVTVHQFARFGG
jgi:hypothetical protein